MSAVDWGSGCMSDAGGRGPANEDLKPDGGEEAGGEGRLSPGMVEIGGLVGRCGTPSARFASALLGAPARRQG